MERAAAECEIYQYPAAPGTLRPVWDGLEGMLAEIGEDGTRGNAAWPGESSDAGTVLRHEAQGETAEKETPGFDAGRKQGIEEGRQMGCAEYLGALAADEKQRVEQAAEFIEQVARERDR